jgi:hypothetical protein
LSGGMVYPAPGVKSEARKKPAGIKRM